MEDNKNIPLSRGRRRGVRPLTDEEKAERLKKQKEEARKKADKEAKDKEDKEAREKEEREEREREEREEREREESKQPQEDASPFDDTLEKVSLFDSTEEVSPFDSTEEVSPFDNTLDEIRVLLSENDETVDYPEDTFDTNPTQQNNIDEIEANQPKVSTPTVDLVIDPNMPYFFIFGSSTAGKSAMLSGLLYYMQTSRIGQLRSIGVNDQENHNIGNFLVNKMTQKVRDGQFIEGTQTLASGGLIFPPEMNLEFQPSGKETMPFCLLEMAGEDLDAIQLTDGGRSGGKLGEGINAYLEHPDCQINFICVVDIDTPKNSEDLINQFLRYIYRAGHTNNPILITVNKWDKIAEKYNSVKEYLEKELPILSNNLFDENRDMAYMKYSIGDVVSDAENNDSYTFKPEDSKKLLEWMYQMATGIALNEEVKSSPLSNIFKSIKKTLSNE